MLNIQAKTTRERLLLTALKCFGHRDYDSVSTREIVDLAGVNISAISYHFNGKQGLYLATAEYLAENIRNQMKPLLDEIQNRLLDAGKDECLQMTKQLIQALVHNLLLGKLSADAVGLIFREQDHPTQAFDFLYEKFMLPMQQTYAMLIGRITDSDPESQHIKLLTHSLVGQVVIYQMGRETILRRLGKKQFSREDVQQIAELVTAASLKAVN
ncbi:MAG: CerR family C-terminal domain-containing protein [Gammaproteobacteria bacterium]|nr:CerR family C-terminal domain-containing protein [Gammaproteobacteria bacterium]